MFSREPVVPMRQEPASCSSHLPLLLSMPPLEKTSAGDLAQKKKKSCVWGGVAGGGGARAVWAAPGRRGQVSSLPRCGFGLMADAGALVRPLELSTRQLCVWAAAATRLGFKPLH